MAAVVSLAHHASETTSITYHSWSSSQPTHHLVQLWVSIYVAHLVAILDSMSKAISLNYSWIQWHLDDGGKLLNVLKTCKLIVRRILFPFGGDSISCNLICTMLICKMILRKMMLITWTWPLMKILISWDEISRNSQEQSFFLGCSFIFHLIWFFTSRKFFGYSSHCSLHAYF